MIKYLISDLDSVLKNKDFVNSLKGDLSLGKLLFVPSNPNEEQKTKIYGEKIINSFKQKEINFSDVDYINKKSNIENFNEYSLIFLMGGVTLIQNEFIKRIKLKEKLEKFKGTMIGMSAGALNMCDVTLDTADFGDSEETVITNGLGVVGIACEVHFDLKNSEQIKEVKETKLKVYCIPNESAIMFKNNKMHKYGDIYLCENDKVIKIS